MTIREIILKLEGEIKGLKEANIVLAEENVRLAREKMNLEKENVTLKKELILYKKSIVTNSDTCEVPEPVDNGDSDVPEEKPKPVRKSRKKKTLEE